MNPNFEQVSASRSWWKPSPDTLAAFLAPQDVRRLIASEAARAPADWQSRAKESLGARLGRELLSAGRGAISIATLGISEIMFRLSMPGKLAAGPALPPLDLVVGPTEAAVLVLDGQVEDVVTAARIQTHEFWQKFDSVMVRGPHLEVVMVDLSPVAVAFPIEIEAGGEVLTGAVDALVSFDVAVVRKVLGLVTWGRQFTLAGSDTDSELATFVSVAGIVGRLRRQLQSQLPVMPAAAVEPGRLRTDPDARNALQKACELFLGSQLFGFGMVVREVRIEVARSADQEHALRRRSAELDRQRQDLVAEQQVVDRRRQQALQSELRQIDADEAISRGATDAAVAQAGEGNRFALARMLLVNDQQLADLQRQGVAKQRESDRTQALLDSQHKQLMAAQEHAAQLERELSGAKTNADISRIKLALEMEQLKVAALAQEGNLLNLRRLREIEREDAQLRDREKAQLERDRITAMHGLTPEQMLAMLADKSPEVAKALAAKFANDGQFAQRSAAEQLAIMQKMQAEMSSLMQQALQANAQVARGLVHGTNDLERARAIGGSLADLECRSCRARLQQQWRACPYCGTAI